MNLFTELKRRNVFRVGVAYVVGAWLLLQFTEVLSELLKLPDEIGPIVVAMVAIGFPVVLFFAWAYEMTPQGIKRESEIDRSQSITRTTGRKLDRAIIAMLVVVAAYFIWESRFAHRSPAEPGTRSGTFSGQPENVPDPISQPAVDRPSIAVLPFTNRSRNEDDAFFVDGIHDDLLTNLARLSELKVISRTSVLRYKDTQKPIPEIAGELGVATVMEGAVQRSGDTVRINVQLIDAQTDEHLWAQIFDRKLSAENLFAIQSEISQHIASALQATLSPEEQQRLSERPTENLEAYNAYLRGRQLMARRVAESVDEAMTEFRRAVELDPGFALAWAAIAENTRWQSYASTLPLPEAMRIAEEAASRALEIDPDLGEAYMALAFNDHVNENFEEAEAKFRKAIELSPGFAQAYDWYSDFLQLFPARRLEALAMIRKAEELDPLSPEIQTEIGEQLLELGRFDAAESLLRRVMQLNPDNVSVLSILSNLMQQTGRFDEQAIINQRAVALDPASPNRLLSLAFTHLELGNKNVLPEIQEKIAEIDPDHWSNGWIEVMENMADKNFDAAIESSRWVGRQFEDASWFQNIFGIFHVMQRDYDQARTAYSIAYPEFFDRTTWRKGLERAPSMGCQLALVLARTGDASMAEDLRQLTANYLEYELPGYIEHADRYFLASCHALAGDREKTIAALQTTVDHGHFGGWWFWLDMPLFDAVRDDERFVALEDLILAKVAAQRENLAQMQAEAGP